MPDDIPESIKLLVDSKASDLKLYVKEEVERSRTRAIAVFTSVAALVAFLSSLGVYQVLKNYMNNTVTKALEEEGITTTLVRIRAHLAETETASSRARAANQAATDTIERLRKLENTINSFRVASGTTPPEATQWQASGAAGINVVVDTSSAGFSTIPIYVPTILGRDGHWETTGATAIYEPTPTSFRIYLRFADGRNLSPETARTLNWSVKWIGFEPVAKRGGAPSP
jgi:hypothetical protein